MINIAVDGFCGSGKTSLVKLLVKMLGENFKILDTGAVFRAFAYAFDKYGYKTMDEKSVKDLLTKTKVEVVFEDNLQHMLVDGEDVTGFLRSEKMSQMSSQISVFGAVREQYLKIAKDFALKNDCIMEGRDIGTVVMPNADVKIFLTANAQSRAKRRYDELIQRGVKAKLSDVLKDLNERDARDSSREIAPLKPSDDSFIVDNTDMDLQETAEYCYNIIKSATTKNKFINVTIDGYVCSGKSTISKELARRLGFKVFDTGALYRAVACAFDYMGLDENKISENYIKKFSEQISLRIEFIKGVQHVFVNNFDHTSSLRTERASALSAKIAPFVCIREKVLQLQRDFAKNNNLVMEGRDIGSFVLPNAEFKFFCTADEQVRAQRRYQQQIDNGNDVKYEDILRQLRERDYADIHRDHGAIQKTPTSIVLDTTNQTLDQSVEFCLKIILKKYPDMKINK